MSTVPPGTGPLSPDFSGIDPRLMDGFVGELEHSRSVIGERTEAIRRVFASEGVSATSLDPIAEVEHWIDERLPDLRRRSKLAHATARLPDWSPSTAGGLVSYEEQQVLPSAEARRLGTELAADYLKVNRTTILDIGLASEYQEIINRLAAHAEDAEFTTAFFARLGEHETLDLPRKIQRGMTNDEKSAIETVSHALGTAISSGVATGTLAQIRKALQDKKESHADQEAVGDLISAGHFPTQWLAQVIATQVFVPGDKAMGSTLTPYLRALARDPGAARLAISIATKDSPLPKDTLARLLPPSALSVGQNDQRLDLTAFLKELSSRSAATPDSADAFGKLLVAASGAYDEQDGAHSDTAVRFAFAVITTADEFQVTDPIRIHLSRIAGSYATEITEGANLGDANHLLPSAFGEVKARISGLNPQFRLSPEDTYRFFKTFSNTPDNQIPFQAGMDILTARLVGQAVPAMLESKDATGLDDTFAALGNVRGFQFSAQEVYGQSKDDADESFDKVKGFVIGAGMGIAGLFPPFETIPYTWTALSTAEAAIDTFKPDDKSEVSKIRKTDDQLTLGRQHAIAQSLMDAGFIPITSPHDYQSARPASVPITDPHGRLLPFSDIAKKGELGLRELDRWFIENGMGSTDDSSLGKVSQRLSDRFNGQKSISAPRAKSLDY